MALRGVENVNPIIVFSSWNTLSWMMKMILDATAGNRAMWVNKKPPNTIFLDREYRLGVPPDIFADNRFCPFRDRVFNCIIYDPPHIISSRGIQPYFNDPEGGSTHGRSWFGFFKNKREMFSSIYKAQKEFQRLTKRLCFKWSGSSVSLWKILPFFKDWRIINKLKLKPFTDKRGVHHPVGKNTYWITFVRNS